MLLEQIQRSYTREAGIDKTPFYFKGQKHIHVHKQLTSSAMNFPAQSPVKSRVSEGAERASLAKRSPTSFLSSVFFGIKFTPLCN